MILGQQADGTWVSYWDASAEAGQWQGYYDGEYASGYSQPEGYNESSRSRKGGRGGKRSVSPPITDHLGRSAHSRAECSTVHNYSMFSLLSMPHPLQAWHAARDR